MINESKWWSDMVWEYSLRSLTDEIIEIKQARAEARKLNIKHDCELIYNQYTELKE